MKPNEPKYAAAAPFSQPFNAEVSKKKAGEKIKGEEM